MVCYVHLQVLTGSGMLEGTVHAANDGASRAASASYAVTVEATAPALGASDNQLLLHAAMVLSDLV